MMKGDRQEKEALRRSHLLQQRAKFISTAVMLVVALPILLSYDWNAATPGFRADAWLYWLAAAVLGPVTYLGLDRIMVLSPPCPRCRQPVLRGSPDCPFCGHSLRRRRPT